MNLFHLTASSSNRKTGYLPVSTSPRETCPDSCPLKGSTCYAENYPLRFHWDKVSSGKRGDTWKDFLGKVRELPKAQPWRYGQAGDLPGKGNRIDKRKLSQLVDANKGRRGWTYTHKPPERFGNLDPLRDANRNGFTVNLSGNDLGHADKLSRYGLPVVVIVPKDHPENSRTPEGRPVLVCPEQTGKAKSCAHCLLCQIPRKAIVAFRLH